VKFSMKNYYRYILLKSVLHFLLLALLYVFRFKYIIMHLYILESCARWVNLHGLQVPAFAGQVWEPALLCVQGGCGLTWCGVGTG